MTKQNGPRLILGLLILKQIGVFENIQRNEWRSLKSDSAFFVFEA